MATAAVSPNRMELLRMKKKQQFAQRGHKLLKTSWRALLKDFTGIVQGYAVLRDQVDSELGELFQQFIVASASMPAEVYRSALAFPECEAELTMTEQLIMNVRVPEFSFAIEGNLLSYGTDGTVVELDQAIVKLKEVLERLVKLAEAEKTIELVADEIEKTRRRVNALEYVLIPQRAETIPHDLLQAGGAGARQHHPSHAHQATPRHVAAGARSSWSWRTSGRWWGSGAADTGRLLVPRRQAARHGTDVPAARRLRTQQPLLDTRGSGGARVRSCRRQRVSLSSGSS